MKNAGWEKIDNEKDAARFIMDVDDYKGHLPPDDKILSQLIPRGKSLRVLDMCCGMGRNAVWLHENRKCEIWGYDLENMVRLARDYTSRVIGECHRIRYVSKLSDMKKVKFDVIICMLSLQHVLPEHLDSYYPFMADALSGSSLGLLCVHGRDWSDHNDKEIVWHRLMKYFEPIQSHPLSRGFSSSTFANDLRPGDHHMAVFRPIRPKSVNKASMPGKKAEDMPWFLDFCGMKMMHNYYVYHVISKNCMSRRNIEVIIELGTGTGAMSTYLGLIGRLMDAKVFTFDLKRPSNHAMHLFKSLDIECINIDVFQNVDYIKKLMAEGATYLVCDDGDKKREFSTFVPFLKSEDMVSVHDYGVEFMPGDAVSFAYTLRPLNMSDWLKHNAQFATWEVV